MLDMYVHTGNEQALGVAEAMAGWARGYFQAVSYTHLDVYKRQRIG